MNQEWINRIEEALREATPLAFADKDAMQDVTNKILDFQKETGRLPEEIQVITQFAVPHEKRLLRESQNADLAARKKQRLDYLSGPNRESVNEELAKLRSPEPARKTFTPEREYTQDEIDRMSDEEANRVLFGRESLGLNKQSSKVDLEAPQNELDQHYRDKILRYRGKDPVMRGLKRQLLDGTEQRDIEYRRRVIESQQADRRKAAADLEAARRGK